MSDQIYQYQLFVTNLPHYVDKPKLTQILSSRISTFNLNLAKKKGTHKFVKAIIDVEDYKDYKKLSNTTFVFEGTEYYIRPFLS